MIVDNPLPPAPASMAPARVCPPADETDSLRGKGNGTAQHAFMKAEACGLNVACRPMWLALGGLHKSTGQRVV